MEPSYRQSGVDECPEKKARERFPAFIAVLKKGNTDTLSKTKPKQITTKGELLLTLSVQAVGVLERDLWYSPNVISEEIVTNYCVMLKHRTRMG